MERRHDVSATTGVSVHAPRSRPVAVHGKRAREGSHCEAASERYQMTLSKPQKELLATICERRRYVYVPKPMTVVLPWVADAPTWTGQQHRNEIGCNVVREHWESETDRRAARDFRGYAASRFGLLASVNNGGLSGQNNADSREIT